MRLIPVTALAAIHSISSIAAAPASGESQPNFIFVLADDMGYGDLACYGNHGLNTPNLDRLAAEGLRIAQFYVNAPICSPSRVAYTTGQYPHRWNITSFLASRAANARRGMEDWLDPSAPTLARMLHEAGYRTGHFGKWHMGGQRDVGDAPLITAYGFDRSLTQFEGLGDRVLPVFSRPMSPN
ncbi:MAG: sulfatase family protein, partial [Opitutaceae bacterium]